MLALRPLSVRVRRAVAKAKTLRIAAGSIDDPRSGVWRVVADRSEVYVGSSKAAMGIFKLSLHNSGVWTLAANVHFFTNHKELKEKVSDSIEKNKAKLFASPDAPQEG